MNEKLARAMDSISESHIWEAATARKSRARVFFRAVAAVLVIAILLYLPKLPTPVAATAVAQASGSRFAERPDLDDYESSKEFSAAYDAWVAQRNVLTAQTQNALSDASGFFRQSSLLYLTDDRANQVWSPANAYIALAMLAEVTAGESRAQILQALGASDLDSLRQGTGAVWESAYQKGHEACELANSLWLDSALEYDPETIDDLAYYHYASVYQTDLGSSRASRALRAWLNNHTGKLLKGSAEGAAFPENAVLTLASTVYLQGKWTKEFSAANNTVDVFHSPGGDVDATYMNKKEFQTNYYWFDNFGAVSLSLKNGCQMWFFLPDEGCSPQDILGSEGYWELLTRTSDWENSKYMKVNLSVPKFDISSGGDLKPMLENMGITDVFDLGSSDFSAITGDSPVFVTGVNQSARVIIDEQGVKAASYIEIPGAGAAEPPEEIIDFILDRPFLFAITGVNHVPLFLGIVNQP